MKSHILIIAILIAVISGLITLNIFFQQSLQMDMAEQFNRQQLLHSRLITENIKSFIQEEREELVLIAHLMSESDIRSNTDLPKVTKKLASFHKESLDKKFGLVGERGKLFFYQGDRQIMKPSMKDMIAAAQGMEPNTTRLLETTSFLSIVSPVYKQGALAYVAFFRFKIEDIANDFVSGVKAGARGYAWMMDKKGNLLYHPTQPAMVGRNLYRADAACFHCHLSFDLEKKIIEGKADNFGRYIAPSGEDKVLAFSTISLDNLSWIVAMSSPYSAVTRTTKHSMTLYSYLIISIFLATSLVSTVLIVLNKKRIVSESVARRKEELEQYAIQLENWVQDSTSELISEKEKLNTIVSAIGGGIVLISKEGKIQWANNMIRDMAGKDVIGLSREDLCGEFDLGDSYDENPTRTVILPNLFGQSGKYFQVTSAAVKSDSGETHGHILLIQDVTEMKAMEEQIIHSEKLASIGRLAAGIAHEIGNPLTSIFSYVQILKEMEDSDEFKRDSLDTISFHINRISGILKQLSGFTKMPGGELKPCSVNEIIDTSLDLIQYDKKAKTITMMKELEDGLPEIAADANQLSQVFVNLILNAIDAMPDGGTLKVTSYVRDSVVAIQFRDTGTGIRKEDLGKIFDPFYTTKEKGTGLGLAVSYNIIKKMNGLLTVDSELGKGTIFTIMLPVNRS
ncbi:MAG: cache domain-containing protein [Nitrospirae bacterium]|nr:cache domain-containing protein [Nitrospirota bacterium]